MPTASVSTLLRMAIAEYHIRRFPKVREFKYSADFVSGNAISIPQIEAFFDIVRMHHKSGLLLVDTLSSFALDYETHLLFIHPKSGLIWHLHCGVSIFQRDSHISSLAFIPLNENDLDTNPPVIIVPTSAHGRMVIHHAKV